MKTLHEISEIEKRFIDFCRSAGFIEIKLTVMDGEPKNMITPLGQKVRFDLPNGIKILMLDKK